MTLNSLEEQDQAAEEAHQAKLLVNRRGSNFQSNNAFDESLRESPIKRRFDADGTLLMDKNSFIGETPQEARRRNEAVEPARKYNNYVEDESQGE